MQSSQFNIQDYIDIILRKRRLIIISFVVFAILSIPIGLLLPKTYRSSTLILVERQQIPEQYVRSTVGVEIGDRLQTISQQITSRSLLEKVIKELNLYKDSSEHMESKVEMMRKNIEIQVRGRDAFTLSFKGNNPETVMKTVNMLASLFIEESLRIREKQVTGTSEFLESELKLIKDKLEVKEKALKEYKTRYIGELPEQLQANLSSLNRFQLELQTTTDALRSAEDRKVAAHRQLEDRKNELDRQGGINPLQNKLDALRTELADLQARYTDRYPDIPRLKREIKETEENIKKEREIKKENPISRINTDQIYQNMLNQIENIEFEINALKERQKNILAQTKLYQERVESAPSREQELITLNRDYENLRLSYQSMLNRKLEAQISENLEKRQKGERFRIVDPANLPHVPVGLSKRLIVLAALGGSAGAALALAILLEFIILGFKKPEEVEDLIKLPVFATIPDLSILGIEKEGLK